jgi:dTDP-4-dehydrorhamnose 3,5-epimerase
LIFTPTRLKDAVIIDVERRGDERGYLARTFCEQEFADHGLVTRFVQASTIFSPECNTLWGFRAPGGVPGIETRLRRGPPRAQRQVCERFPGFAEANLCS